MNKIRNELFKNEGRWYELGASMTDPPKDGFGYFLTTLNIGLSSRHGTAVAAILVAEGYLEHQGQKPILLRKK
ncbi:MAG: hypothetical protein GDA51_06970 [Ekhidna sp.]|nr:hypothetical protein [Ekhidna sp.]MBC6426200.1 hypothetical protein [Ekhidna sp.]